MHRPVCFALATRAAGTFLPNRACNRSRKASARRRRSRIVVVVAAAAAAAAVVVVVVATIVARYRGHQCRCRKSSPDRLDNANNVDRLIFTIIIIFFSSPQKCGYSPFLIDLLSSFERVGAENICA